MFQLHRWDARFDSLRGWSWRKFELIRRKWPIFPLAGNTSLRRVILRRNTELKTWIMGCEKKHYLEKLVIALATNGIDTLENLRQVDNVMNSNFTSYKNPINGARKSEPKESHRSSKNGRGNHLKKIHRRGNFSWQTLVNVTWRCKIYNIFNASSIYEFLQSKLAH